MSTFENQSEITDIDLSNNALQHSFFKNLDATLDDRTNFKPVINFDIAEMKNNKEFNDQNSKHDYFLSTKSSKKSEDNLWAGNVIHNSNSEILCSGYFGPRDETKMADNFGNFNNFYLSTNPFSGVEERNFGWKTKINNELELSNSKINAKKQKLLNDNFNGSFLGGINMNKNTCLNKSISHNSLLSNSVNVSASTTSFNDLVKSVNITNKSKKSKIFF